MQYNLETTKLTFREKFGGKANSYIKMQEIVQNDKGDFYAVAYFDYGRFRIRTFGKETRESKTIREEEFDINSALGINKETIPNSGNSDPFINIDFIDDQSMFVSLFHNKSLTHWHFIYNFREKKIQGEPVSFVMEKSSKENYPINSYYNNKKKEFYVFYREGESFIIQKDISNFFFDKITDKDLGFLFDN